jgi:hypothetical protein
VKPNILVVCGADVLWLKVRWCAKRYVQELLEVPAFALSGECLERRKKLKGRRSGEHSDL